MNLKSLKVANLNCEYLSPVVATLQAHPVAVRAMHLILEELLQNS